MIGLFGVSEALYQLRLLKMSPVKQDVSKILPSWSVILKYLPLSIRTSFIGVFIGALPGTGGDIASLMAYDHAKRTVKNPSRPLGKVPTKASSHRNRPTTPLSAALTSRC